MTHKKTLYFAILKETNTKIAKKCKIWEDPSGKEKKRRCRALASRTKDLKNLLKNHFQNTFVKLHLGKNLSSFKTLLQNNTQFRLYKCKLSM